METLLNKLEEWAPVHGFTGYEVSSFGNVRSKERKVARSGSDTLWTVYGRRIKTRIHRDTGYVLVTLCKKGKTHHHYVHRLVAFAFLDKVKGKEEVNHKNKINNDNRVENLEWVNRSENVIHSLFGKKRKQTIFYSDALRIRSMSESGMSVTTISLELGISTVQVKRIISGKAFKAEKTEYHLRGKKTKQ